MFTTERQSEASSSTTVRRLQRAELDDADRIMRTAFGTFLGAPEPALVFGDAEYVRPRFAAEPNWAFSARHEDEFAGSNFATRWGSFGFFGPLTVRPDLWGRGIGSRLMEPIMDLFEGWQLRQTALFTFPQSVKHIGLYQKFGFWPQHLTPLLEKRVEGSLLPQVSVTEALYSSMSEPEQIAALAGCRELTDSIFDGLDVGHEIRATLSQRLGDTVLLHGGSRLDGFAVCHLGAGEAGSGCCFVKFAAARPGPGAGGRFDRLLDACEKLAAARGLERAVAGVNATRHDAYRRLLARGYRTWLEGVIMQRPNEAGYCRPDVYVVDDLR